MVEGIYICSNVCISICSNVRVRQFQRKFGLLPHSLLHSIHLRQLVALLPHLLAVCTRSSRALLCYSTFIPCAPTRTQPPSSHLLPRLHSSNLFISPNIHATSFITPFCFLHLSPLNPTRLQVFVTLYVHDQFSVTVHPSFTS
jgi:hypothetical protein